VRIDTTVTHARVFPLIEVSREQLVKAVGSPIVSAEPVDGGLTNTIHKVVTEAGETFGVKHYAGGKDWFEAELATLTLLHRTLPVPEVVHVDDEQLVIVYRWIDGITLHELRRQGLADAFASLAAPLGGLLAWLARGDATEAFEVSSILERRYEQLTTGRARTRIGAALADGLRKGLEAAEPAMAWGSVCLSHGDLGHRNVIVARSGERWRINGVIDWETSTTGSPLFDIGSLFRYADRHDAAFRAAFERGYRDAGGALPDRWLVTARLLDITWLVDLLDDEQEIETVFADCQRLIAKLVAEL